MENLDKKKKRPQKEKSNHLVGEDQGLKLWKSRCSPKSNIQKIITVNLHLLNLKLPQRTISILM